MKSKWYVIRADASGKYLVVIGAGFGRFHATQILDKERATMSQNFHSLKKYIGPLEKEYGGSFSVVPLDTPKRKNPNEADSIWDRTEVRKKEGERLANNDLPRIQAMISRGRYGNNTASRNMIRALEMHSWQNSVEDWQRYFTAKLIAKYARKRKNPAPSYKSRAARLLRIGKSIDAKMEIERDKLMAQKKPGVKKRITGKTYYSPKGKAFREQVQKGIRLSDMLMREAGKENRRKNPSNTYEVIVGNIGTVLTTKSKQKAVLEYKYYVADSKKPFGRASGESVTLMYDGEPILEHFGKNEE